MLYSDFLNIAKRSKLTLLAIFLTCVGLASVLAISLPAIYQSSATILIQVADVQNLPSTTGGYIDAQLEKVERRAQSDENLWRLVERYKLYEEHRTQEDKREIIGRMRSNIEREIESFETVNPHAQTGSSAGTFMFTISFKAGDAETARNVTRDLADLYVQENAKTRSKKAEDVTKFLEQIVGGLKIDVEKLASKVTSFKKENINALPEQEKTNREFLEKAEYDLAIVNENILGWSTRKRQLESEIAVSKSGDLSVKESLAELRVQLTEARTRYSELHPDVRKIKAEIAAMETEIRSGRGGQLITRESEVQRSTQKAANINRNAALAEVNQKLRSARLSKEQLDTKIREYEARLVNAPTIGLEYEKINRELSEANKNYQQMKEKLMEARLAEQVEKEEKGERYIVHKNAALPAGPSSPNVPILLALGVILGLGLSFGYIALISMFDKKIYGTAGVTAIFDAPPLAVIPVLK